MLITFVIEIALNTNVMNKSSIAPEDQVLQIAHFEFTFSRGPQILALNFERHILSDSAVGKRGNREDSRGSAAQRSLSIR